MALFRGPTALDAPLRPEDYVGPELLGLGWPLREAQLAIMQQAQMYAVQQGTMAAAELGAGPHPNGLRWSAIGNETSWTTPYMRGPLPDATQRARALLSRLLSPGQRRQWAAHGSFIERGSDGRKYVLGSRCMYRIEEDTGERREYLCVLPELEPGSPAEDAIIARLLCLRADATSLRQQANVMPIARGG